MIFLIEAVLSSVGLSLFFHLHTVNLGPVFYYLLYLYSIHRAICRPSDSLGERPRAEIRTGIGGSSGRDTSQFFKMTITTLFLSCEIAIAIFKMPFFKTNATEDYKGSTQ